MTSIRTEEKAQIIQMGLRDNYPIMEVLKYEKKSSLTITEEPVKEFMIGNTNIRIFDDQCKDKTSEDVQKILDRIAMIVIDSISEAS